MIYSSRQYAPISASTFTGTCSSQRGNRLGINSRHDRDRSLLLFAVNQSDRFASSCKATIGRRCLGVEPSVLLSRCPDRPLTFVVRDIGSDLLRTAVLDLEHLHLALLDATRLVALDFPVEVS